jgi:hypothetical protein
MQRNDKIKYAVTAALSAMAFGFQASSFAIGLGDIDVKSNLGQPLKARINVLGANDLKDASCLRLGPNSGLSHVNFNLGPVSGNIAKLTLTSNKVINEPILNLSVIAGCDSSIRRDYILLLDPPYMSQNAVEVGSIEAPVIVGKVDTPVETSTSQTTVNIKKAQTKAKTTKKKTVTSKKKISKKAKVVAKKSTGVSNVTHTEATKINSVAAEPRLSISGGNYAASNASSTGLRLDRQLSFTPDPNTAVTAETIAIEDEVTVMNKRLAHLQKQITTLQEQNLKLASENKLKSEQLTQADAFTFGSLLPYIGTGLLLIGGFVAYHWLRRRESLLQTHNTEAIWINTNTKAEDAAENLDDTPITQSTFDEVNFDINDSIEDNQLVPSTMESTFESTKTEEDPIVVEDDQQFSVLDHADVFLSHGRTALAIQLLQNHLIDHPKQSVTIWLFLLDLLAKENLEKIYEQTAEECKLHFNVQIPDFAKSESTSNESLEDFPRLAEGLQSVWNTPAAVTYLDDLIYNNRLEPRAGLAKNLIEELVLLRSMSQENVNSADVIHLDEKKLAINEEKEALLKERKEQKLNEMAEADRIAKEKAEAEKIETDFEFTLVEKY